MILNLDKNFTDLLWSTFTVKRKVKTPDGLGGYTLSYTTIGTIKGKLDPMFLPREPVNIGKFRSFNTHILYTVCSSNILRDDKIEGEGKVLRVIALKEPSEANHHYEIHCEEIQ